MKKPRIIILSVLLLSVVTGSALFLISQSNYGPSFDEVSHLLTPRIIEKPSSKMLVVEAVGDHEEEYLRGPGIRPRNPDGYLTILRYEVRKSTSADTM